MILKYKQLLVCNITHIRYYITNTNKHATSAFESFRDEIAVIVVGTFKTHYISILKLYDIFTNIIILKFLKCCKYTVRIVSTTTYLAY